MKRQNLKYYFAVGVALITFIVYLASLQNEFVEWDDGQYVFENLHIRAFDMDFLKWAFFDFYAANWHPLTWISHALDYAVWGLNPLGHHLTNNILHAVNTFLVVLLVVRLMEAGKPSFPPPVKVADKEGIANVQDKKKIAKGADKKKMPLQRTPPLEKKESPFTFHNSHFTFIAAGVTGLLFGLHPLHVESVAWVAERKDLLCGLFFLLSIMMYMSYRYHKTYRTYFLTLAFFSLALLSKPMAVSLPVVLLILDWYPFGRVRSFNTFRTALAEKIPFIVLSLLSSILTILAQKTETAMKLMEFVPLSTRIVVAAHSLITYLWKVMLPINLSPFYPYPENINLFTMEYLLPVALIIAITTIAFVMGEKKRLLLSAWGYYVLTLVPVIGIVQVGEQSMADRYTYLPSLGPFLIIGLLAALVAKRMHASKKHRLIVMYSCIALASFVFLTMTFLTVKQIGIWRNSFTLWNCVIEKEPERVPVAYNDRGLGFGKAGLFDKAIEDFNMAIKIRPSYPLAYGNRGYAYYLTGQNERALDDFNQAIKLDRDYVKAYTNRGVLYLKTNNNDLAMADFQRACDLGDKEACNALQTIRSSTLNQGSQ